MSEGINQFFLDLPEETISNKRLDLDYIQIK